METTASQLSQDIAKCMLADQHSLRQLCKMAQSEIDGERLAAALEKSKRRREERARHLPKPVFPEDLPVSQRRREIADAIATNQVVIVCGETGSGKTTQLPKICLELGRGVAGMIGHTQPRRIAARSIAARIATELESQVGKSVGYKVRFNDRLSRDTYIKLMTDGILLAETQHDRFLTHYDTLIIDEAHERSLNIDFLLGYIKQLLPKRPELKVIITSATIDPQRFSQHFDSAPIIEVSGRTYPIEVRYRPVKAEEPDEEDPTLMEAIVRAVGEVKEYAATNAISSDAGLQDVLIFLSGEREIRETAEALEKAYAQNTEILPLYARLSVEEQNRVFQPHGPGVQRIVLATNVAETSLTVPGIRYVIDPGLARTSRYSANARVQRLPIEPISRASADQRKGRCGRIGPGLCIRLYSEEDYDSRELFTDPEILRANLASVILQMKALRLGEIERFPFVEPPRPGMVREGYQTLLELGAVDDHWRITRLGHELARLPIDPRIGRMILAARKEQALKEVLIIAAALATQDPRLRPMDAALAADAAHAQFLDESSDFLSYLKIWNWYQEHAAQLSTNKLRKLCQQHFLSFVRLREWQDVHQQLHALVTENGMKLNEEPARYESVHRSLLTGLLNNVGSRTETHEYLGPRERKFSIFPGSGLFKKGPKWIMAAELVETTRLYGRIVARIHPEWIEQLAPHLLKRSHSDPHWNEQSAHVEAYERISMHGLIIVPKRRIHFGPINPTLAREIFINQGLVEGAWPPPFNEAAFFQHNRALMSEIRTIEAKVRRRNVMVNHEAVFSFYDRIIPRDVYNGPLFERWRRKAERQTPQMLFLSRTDLFRSDAPTLDENHFPDSLSMDGIRVPLSYQFDPGGEMDGVTATVPIEAIQQISERAAQWLVPGLLKEKATELLRTLPKSIRRNFVPAPEYAELAVQSIQFGEGDLLEQLGAELHRRVGEPIPREAWKPESLPDYLKLNFAIVDATGQEVAHGRDLSALRQRIRGMTSADPGPKSQPSILNEHSLPTAAYTSWTFGELPRSVTRMRNGITVLGFPALVDEGQSVSVHIFDAAPTADRAHRAGVRRLFVLQVQDELAAHIDYLPRIDDLLSMYASLPQSGDEDEFKQDMIDAVADRVFIADASVIYSQVEFERRLRSGWQNLWSVASELGELAFRILSERQSIDLQLDSMTNPLWSQSVEDVRLQLASLMPAHFLLHTPAEWLAHYPRFLAAISARLRKLIAGGGNVLVRDAHGTAEIADLWQRYLKLREVNELNAAEDANLETFRWMLEEYRVSLFAQEIGTSLPVSAKRLEAQWARVSKR